MADCLFCRIVAGEIPASVVWRDELVIAFLDIQPVNPGHTLIVPCRHAGGLAELDAAAAAALMATAQRVAGALRAGGLVRCEGVNLHLADGEAAGQEVGHVHLHVIPRYGGDGFGFRKGPGWPQQPSRESLDSLAAELGQRLAG